MAFLVNPMSAPRRSENMSLSEWICFSIGLGLLLLSLLYRNLVFRETIRYSLEGIALFPLFYFAIKFHNSAIFRHLNSAWAVRIGTYSYVIYLVHQIVLLVIEQQVPSIRNQPFLIFPATLIVSIAYAAAIERFVDPCFRQLRRKYGSAKPASIPAATEFLEAAREHNITSERDVASKPRIRPAALSITPNFDHSG
jgi:peptidoglycan/LPS O-acetylase OafA/YrhL